MGYLPDRQRRSTLSRVDNGLLVVGAVVAVFLFFQLLSAIVGTIMFAVKVAIVAGVVVLAARLLRSRER